MTNEANVNQEEVKAEQEETKDLVEKDKQAVQEVAEGGAYITTLLETVKEDFLQVNAGLDLDFVYMGTWLVTNAKGEFVEKDDEDINYGDTLDVVIGAGEKRWTLWGQQDSPEEGELIAAEKEEEDAIAVVEDFLEANPEAAERYTIEDLDLRYLAYVVPVESLDDGFPNIYLMSFPKTTTIQYGKWAMSLFKGKYKDRGIPARTGVNQVVTRLTTSQKTSGNNSWIGTDFEAVGMFNPEEYNLDEFLG